MKKMTKKEVDMIILDVQGVYMLVSYMDIYKKYGREKATKFLRKIFNIKNGEEVLSNLIKRLEELEKVHKS